MKIDRNLPYYLLLLLYPLAFLLHNINENFGLTEPSDLIFLLALYLAIGFSIAFLCRLIFRTPYKAYVFSFLLLLVYFLFGTYKDFANSKHFPAVFNSYKFLLPELAIALIATAVLLKRHTGNLLKPTMAITVFLVLNAVAETGWFGYNVLRRMDRKQDFGDLDHTLIRNLAPAPAAPGSSPTIFWLIFDEYSASSSLKKGWRFNNPLDAELRAKGFFVADSARSSYNFTPYSFASMLDMQYLSGLKNHDVLQLRDLRRGAISIYENNTVQLLQKGGYDIYNATIFQLKDHPTHGIDMFGYIPRALINYQTFGARVYKDIGWNLPGLFSRNKHKVDSMLVIKSMIGTDKGNKELYQQCLQRVRSSANTHRPSFNLLHFLLPHEPYMYRADGSINFAHGFSNDPADYIPHLQYTNTLINAITDTILNHYRNKDLVIIVQGDHGFRYDQADPLYEQESSRILYAVYCSDHAFPGWNASVNAVNSFRILFNKYFHTGFPMLPSRSYNLQYIKQ